jgi:hypothetical protein
MPLHTNSTSAKCNYVTGSVWECLRVVGPESQCGQIPELTGPMQWPADTPGSTRDKPGVMWKESTPRYTQLEVSLQSIPLSCLAIGLDIGLIQGLIDSSLRSFIQVQNVIRVE